MAHTTARFPESCRMMSYSVSRKLLQPRNIKVQVSNSGATPTNANATPVRHVFSPGLPRCSTPQTLPVVFDSSQILDFVCNDSVLRPDQRSSLQSTGSRSGSSLGFVRCQCDHLHALVDVYDYGFEYPTG